MSYAAHYLRFASQAEADQVLDGVDLAARDDVGEPQPDEEHPTPPSGWHVNVIIDGDVPEVLQPYVVTPATPARRFAGY